MTGLTKSYGPVRAVDDLELQITAGEMVAILGPNGAGKSTITELITGLVRPDAGSVRIFGGDPSPAVAAGRVGAMLQGGALLYDASIRDVLRLVHGLHAHPLPMGEIIELADLSGFLSTKTDKLSGGQAQRLRFALAIMADPDLLILDEPTVAMDVELRRAFWASMRTLSDGGRTVLFATHYLQEADQIADRIVVLDRGRIVADGTSAEIKSRVAGKMIMVAEDGLRAEELASLPAVTSVDRRSRRVALHTTDSDLTLRALVARFPAAHDIGIVSADLEEAFLALTHHDQVSQEAR
ncbi:ABC transporter ATP-binding protein [Microlunatus endophyticus]|uniref:ABC transporter ATP-binding protein n=2 Tax=Microlunatus endophyticus TaxID=1716077 RepID=A0A917SH53_9ACTN|nr:ABC transporter ATP-binding protein [Microlunatus endophyticus]